MCFLFKVSKILPVYLCVQSTDPPPEKKPKLDDTTTAAASSSLAHEEVGVVNAVEEDDTIPKIKSSHLNLDDIPMELLPTHQEKIMKQVSAIYGWIHNVHVQCTYM